MTEGSSRVKIVFVGHVDHGKSTLIGRILSDTSSLPEGKLEQVQRACTAENMEFEFAFLLDALLEEFNITRLRKTPSIALSGG